MFATGSARVDAERAFAHQVRAQRRAALARRLRRDATDRDALAIYEGPAGASGAPVRRVAVIPIEAISGTVEPSRAPLFDRSFRPTRAARERWQRIWLAEQAGAPLPPISVVPTRDGFAVRDGHHRVSVAKARGAVAIDATIDGLGA